MTDTPPGEPPTPRLLDQVRHAIRLRHYSRRTEDAYAGWIRRFILFHGKRHPVTMGEPEITRYLSWLAVEKNPSWGDAKVESAQLLSIAARRNAMTGSSRRISTAAVGLFLIVCPFLVTSAALCQEFSWAPRTPATSPLARSQHALAYDEARGRVVLFGGATGLGLVADTWEWDGTNWIQKPGTGPRARYGHAMAYDGTHVVLFGGQAANGDYLADTWEWDGANWIQQTPAVSPPARIYHTMAYDSVRGRVVLFGGGNPAGYLADTWEWNGADWVELHPVASPSARYGHALAYDRASQRVVLFGGWDVFYLNDTWEWNGTNWTERHPAASPSLRRFHAMAFDRARGRVVLFGGNGADYDDTWEWDNTNWTQRAPTTSPQARYQHALVYDSAHGHVVLFGGDAPAGGLLADTWQYPGCSPFADQSLYGRLLFPSLCTRDASTLAQDVYARTVAGVYRGAHDNLYLSSDGMRFAPLAVDDVVHVNGLDSGLGPYTRRPGVPPFLLDVPIESNLVALPAQNVTSLMPLGQSTTVFESLDTDRAIYGSTAVYLVADCGTLMSQSPLQINFISHDDQVTGQPPEFDVRYGLISQLRIDKDFRNAACLGHFFDTPATITSGDPNVGDGYYFLVRGTSSASCNNYGDSTLTPDPRRALDGAAQCQ
jgi:integrase-like protein/galactose oxidase-like protein/Kelch motif protein